MATSTLDSVQERVLSELREDHVGLWLIARKVRESLGHASAAEVQTETLHLVRRLLDARNAAAGFPTVDGVGFRPWKLTPAAAVKRIKQSWDQLGHEPNIGEVVWFSKPKPRPASRRPAPKAKRARGPVAHRANREQPRGH
jgi:hypothetical protein